MPDTPEACHASSRSFRGDRLQVELSAQDAAFVAILARMQARAEAARATCRVRCRAKTRKGMPCRIKSEPGKHRCKSPGGKSAAARTPEGKARIANAQGRRCAKWRVEQEQAHDPAVTCKILAFSDARA